MEPSDLDKLTPGTLLVVNAFDGLGQSDRGVSVMVFPESQYAHAYIRNGTLGLFLGTRRYNTERVSPMIRIFIDEKVYLVAMHHLRVYHQSK